MVTNLLTVTDEEVAQIRSSLASRGCRDVPKPESVEVVTTHDHDGASIILMTVVFPKDQRPDDLPWERVNPLVRDLRRLVFKKDREERPVVAEIRRLGEKSEEDSRS